jgi:hypothetical protein
LAAGTFAAGAFAVVALVGFAAAAFADGLVAAAFVTDALPAGALAAGALAAGALAAGALAAGALAAGALAAGALAAGAFAVPPLVAAAFDGAALLVDVDALFAFVDDALTGAGVADFLDAAGRAAGVGAVGFFDVAIVAYLRKLRLALMGGQIVIDGCYRRMFDFY